MPQVIVCAENAVTRAGLAAMVAATAVEVVGQVSTVSQLKDWLRNQSVDLVLLAPSELTGTVAHEVVQIVTEWIFEPSLAVLLFVELWDAVSLIDPPLAKEPVQQQRLLAPLLATGSVSMMPLTVSTAQVQGAIAAILRGFVVLHPEVVELIAAHSVNWTAEPDLDSDPPLEPLTPREIEVLNHLATGLSNKAIANQLIISEHTVKFHISAILAKLGVASRTEAVAVGIRAGIVRL